MKINRQWAMPNKNTFTIQPVREIIYKNIYDYKKNNKKCLIIDPFANNSKIADITNDLDEQYNTDYHLDAFDFLDLFKENSVDIILYDPPYSSRQVSESYKKMGKTFTQKN